MVLTIEGESVSAQDVGGGVVDRIVVERVDGGGIGAGRGLAAGAGQRCQQKKKGDRERHGKRAG